MGRLWDEAVKRAQEEQGENPAFNQIDEDYYEEPVDYVRENNRLRKVGENEDIYANDLFGLWQHFVVIFKKGI